MKTRRLLSVSLFGAFLFTSLSAMSFEEPALKSDLAQKVIAHQRALEEARAPIKSERDLQRYLAAEPSSSPLNALSPSAKNKFLQSLVFSDKGLASYRYRDLEEQLSASQIYDVLSLFGTQGTTNLIGNAKVETQADALILGTVRPKLQCIPDEVFGCAPGTGGSGGGESGGGGDHENYRCAGPQAHTCIKDRDSICTHNC